MMNATSVRPEAELEALLASALSTAFPFVPRHEFRHQTHFKVELGKASYLIDGERLWSKAGRADIIIFHKNRALAVVELKRQDKVLTDADKRQGLSYASKMTPRPPLVIVTNGKSTNIYDGFSGEVWSPPSDGGEAISKLFANSAKVAAAGLEWAVEVLMGPEAGVWMNAVRARTQHLIKQLSGTAAETNKPFIEDLHFPRQASHAALDLLNLGKSVILISGSPQIGKTHILREVFNLTLESQDYAVFMVRAGQGAGLFQRIANVLSAALEWNVDAGDVRQWLRRLSHFSNGPALVLALDGLAGETGVAVDVEELCESGFGPKLRIMATIDDARTLVTGANGRSSTAIAGVAVEVKVEPLDEQEWSKAQEALKERNIEFTNGAAFALEYRIPWVLRAIFADIVTSPEYQAENVTALLPATLGLELVHQARGHLSHYGSVQASYRLLARDAINDTTQVSPELHLERSYAFVIRRDALSLEARETIEPLISQGWLTSYRHAGNEDVLSPTAPELFLSELAFALASELIIQVDNDAFAAGQWLADRLDGVFLGDLIGAQAVLDLAATQGGYPSQLYVGLLDRRPQIEIINSGRFAFLLPDGSLQDFVLEENGSMFLLNEQGQRSSEPIDVSDDTRHVYRSLAGWMILSQLAAIPSEAETEGRPRGDLSILLEVSTCPIPLMRVARVPLGHLVHNIKGHGSVLCPDNGVIEPITAAMQRTFSVDGQGLSEWFDEALSRRSLPLLNRILIALRAVRRSGDQTMAPWAHALLETRVGPAMEELLKTPVEAIE